MPRNRAHFFRFAPHTRVKHLVLQTYVDEWARKLLLGRGAGDAVCFVDTCAGEGADSEGSPGSPLIAAESARMVMEQLAGPQFGRNVRVYTVAIEKRPYRVRRLRERLAPYAPFARVLQGTLTDHIDQIQVEFENIPTLYFIDPFGLEALRAELVSRALRGRQNEVLALFADQAALRHFGAATSEDADVESELAKVAPEGTPSLFDEWEPEWRQDLRSRVTEEVDQQNAHREKARRNSIEILNAAFGGPDWLEEVERVPREERRTRFRQLYENLLRRFGASRVLWLPVRNEQDRHVYHLVHASKSPHGYKTMKEAISHALNQGALQQGARESMRFAVRQNTQQVVEDLRRRYAGKQMPWTSDDRNVANLRQYLMEDTPLFPFQTREVRQALKEFKEPGRGPEFYQFPSL